MPGRRTPVAQAVSLCLAPAAAENGRGDGADYLAPLGWITIMGLLLVGALALAGLVMWLLSAAAASWPAAPPGVAATWCRRPECNTPRPPLPRCWLALFGWALRPHIRRPANLPLFPQKADFHSDIHDTVLDEAVVPAFRLGAWLCSKFRVLQQGSIQTYLLYIFIALIALLLVISFQSLVS